MMNVKTTKTKSLALILALLMAALLCAPVAYAEETTEAAITEDTTTEGAITEEEPELPEEPPVEEPPVEEPPVEEKEPVRGTYVAVGIKYGSSAVDSVHMYSNDGFQIVDISDGIVETLPLTGYTHLVITSRNGLINVNDENGVTLVTDLGKNGVIMNGDWLGDGNFKSSVNNRTYRGGLKFHVRDNGDLNVINYLSLDHYLYGVIQGEMGHQNPLESLKAQTVAARSYAMTNKGRHKSEGFDVCNVSHCQMYYGVDYEKAKTIQAVDETSGLVIWYNNKIVPAYYSKNNGGYVQATEDVWGNVTGYLKAKEDPYAPEYKWTATYGWEDLEERITDIGRIKDAYITKWTDNGNVYEMTFVGSTGTKTLLREKVRTTLGGSTCKSLRFELEGGSGQTIVIPAKATVLGADGVKAAREDVVVYGADGVKSTCEGLNGMVVLGASGTTTLKDTETKSMASDEGITLTGYGYGHGIGMAQDSAIVMGEEGMTFEEILNFFYTDIEIDYEDRNEH
ncbi:MAG: SpoIID/LytB domain-containing protein [Firmicutes bacterium]|nr:SpoIID/LytB domain-containing protein [Bacillota bacterium]